MITFFFRHEYGVITNRHQPTFILVWVPIGPLTLGFYFPLTEKGSKWTGSWPQKKKDKNRQGTLRFHVIKHWSRQEDHVTCIFLIEFNLYILLVYKFFYIIIYIAISINMIKSYTNYLNDDINRGYD